MFVRRFGFLLCSVSFGLPAAAWALSDPTRPQDYQAALVVEADGSVAAEVEVEPSFALQYVLVSEQRRYAVINGQRVIEGDRVGDARILHIRPGLVRIRSAGETKELNLGYTDIKKSQGRIAQ